MQASPDAQPSVSQAGVLRPRFSHQQSWEDRRRHEIDFDYGDPTVLVIGAGHSGLEVAARLTYLGVPTLVIDRNQRIGDNVRFRMHPSTHAKVTCGSGGHDTRRYAFMTRFVSRYVEYMRHLKVTREHRDQSNAIPRVSRHMTTSTRSTIDLAVLQFSNHMACLLSCPKGAFDLHTCIVADLPQLGDWLESYATALDLNVWLSSSITNTSFNQETRTWQVTISRGERMRTMTVKHLVFATGYGGGFPNMPDVPGKVGQLCVPSSRPGSKSPFRG